MTEQTEPLSLIAYVRVQLDETERVAIAARDTPVLGVGSVSGEWRVSAWEVHGTGVVYAGPGDGHYDQPWDSEGGNLAMQVPHAEHVALHDPHAVLARVAAERRFLDEVEQVGQGFEGTAGPDPMIRVWVGMMRAVTLFALQYEGRPGWDPQWTKDAGVPRG